LPKFIRGTANIEGHTREVLDTALSGSGGFARGYRNGQVSDKRDTSSLRLFRKREISIAWKSIVDFDEIGFPPHLGIDYHACISRGRNWNRHLWPNR
jgi:hypothetical protein